jgi:hypothetical protein
VLFTWECTRVPKTRRDAGARSVAMTLLWLGLIASCAGCYHAEQKVHFGSNNGEKSSADVDRLITALRMLPVRYPAGVETNRHRPTAPEKDFLHLYFSTAYNGELVDLVYFVDVDGGPTGPTIRSELARGDDRPTTLKDEQNVWALIMVAIPQSYCFTADLQHAVIAPNPSPAETGIVAALLSMTKLGAKPDAPLTSHDDRWRATLPRDGCKSSAGGAGASSGSKNDDDKGKGKDEDKDKDKAKNGAPTQLSFQRVGSSPGRDLYAGLVKLSLSAGTTNRMVLSSHYNSDGVNPQSESATTSAVTVFRNASRPYFRTSVGLGMRLELEAEHTTTETTERGKFYDPDLYVMFHALPGVAGFLKKLPGSLGAAFGDLEDLQLRAQWYPSLFIGTNLISRSVFTDLVFGVRFPTVFSNKAGVALGGDWTRFSFNTVESCTSACVTRSRRHLGLFVGIDYDF